MKESIGYNEYLKNENLKIKCNYGWIKHNNEILKMKTRTRTKVENQMKTWKMVGFFLPKYRPMQYSLCN